MSLPAGPPRAASYLARPRVEAVHANTFSYKAHRVDIEFGFDADTISVDNVTLISLIAVSCATPGAIYDVQMPGLPPVDTFDDAPAEPTWRARVAKKVARDGDIYSYNILLEVDFNAIERTMLISLTVLVPVEVPLDPAEVAEGAANAVMTYIYRATSMD